MQGWLVKAGVALVALLAWHGVARAVDLTSFTAKDEEKKLTLTFTFSAKVQADVISNFAGNFVALAVGELKFTKEQLSGEHLPAAEGTAPFYRCVRFVAGEHAGQIRVQMGKLATPADALVVQQDNRIDVEITKPVWKLKHPEEKPKEKPALPAVNPEGNPEQAPAANPPEAPAAPGASETPPAEATQPPAESTPPTETETPPAAPETPPAETETPPAAPETPPSTEQPPGSLRDGSAPAPSTPPPAAAPEEQPPAAPEPGAAPEAGGEAAPEATPPAPSGSGGEVYGQTSPSELPQGAPEEPSAPAHPQRHGTPLPPPPPPTTEQPPAETTPPAPATPPTSPAPSETTPPAGAPSRTHAPYTAFDLDQVPISGIEIRGLPFNQALMKLVGTSGFNVVLGEGLDTTEVNLSFRQRDITLKGALDLLCIAYDLVYTVEPDAIVIKRK